MLEKSPKGISKSGEAQEEDGVTEPGVEGVHGEFGKV
jgi:hypothetical protein